jgi:hypothetical protein
MKLQIQTLTSETREVSKQVIKGKGVYIDKLKPGHIYFRINLKKWTISPAPVQKQIDATNLRKDIVPIEEDDCMYISALNETNACKRFIRITNELNQELND